MTLLPLPEQTPLLNGFALPRRMYRHPNIAMTYGVTEVDTTPTLVIEKLQTSLSHLLRQFGNKLTLRERVDLAFGIVSAIDFLHCRHGVIHGMITIDRIFFTSQLTAKVLDPTAAILSSSDPCPSPTYKDDMTQLGRILLRLFTVEHSDENACRDLLTLVRVLVSNNDNDGPDGSYSLLEVLDRMRRSEPYLSCPPKREFSCQLYERP